MVRASRVLAFVAVLSALAIPAAVAQACPTTGTSFSTGTGPVGLPPYNVFVAKNLGPAFMCTAVVMSAYCVPGTAAAMTMGGGPQGMTVNAVFAYANTLTATMPACSWVCAGCGTVTIDGSDGLPVELMDFSVAPDESAEGESEESATDDG